jgi:hypothetical protein
MGERFQGILHRCEEQSVDGLLVFPCQIPQLPGQREGNQEVLARQPLVKLAFQPLAALVVLAMRAVSVAAGVGNIHPFTAPVIRTLGQHVWSMLMSASGHGRQGFAMARQQSFIVDAEKAVFELVDNHGEQHYLRPPHSMSRELTKVLTANLALLAVVEVRWVYLAVVRMLT